jgi:hypothetical protein
MMQGGHAVGPETCSLLDQVGCWILQLFIARGKRFWTERVSLGK